MSKVLPARQFQPHDNELENVCPRYQKWMKQITKVPDKKTPNSKVKEKPSSNSKGYINFFSSRLSKRKRNKKQCDRHGSTEDDEPCLNGKAKEKPLRSKSIFFRIRQKGRNFGIRCKTSVELWRKWIKKGIHWDRSPPKPVDIDIITAKTDNKLKDFSKKSIINEIIPEEDEEDSESIVGKTSKVNESKQNEKVQQHQTSNGSAINGVKEKSPERNFLTEISYIQKASNLFKHSKPHDEDNNKASIPANGSEEEVNRSGKAENGNQAKYPINDLASMDIERIEKIEVDSEKTNGSAAAGRPRVPPPAHGALNRAFNKLKLFF